MSLPKPEFKTGDRVEAQPLAAISPRVTITGRVAWVAEYDLHVVPDGRPDTDVRQCYRKTAVKL